MADGKPLKVSIGFIGSQVLTGRIAQRVMATRPTFAALGQVGRIEHFDRIVARFAG